MCYPVKPAKPTLDDIRKGGVDEGDEVIDPKDVLIGDRIVGVEHVTYDGHNPGAIEIEPMTTPPQMTPTQWAKHSITHLPYHPGCSICRACKRPNNGHMKTHEAERSIPLLVGDYAFCRDSKDESLATLLILRLLPYRLTYAFVVPAKGPDPLVVTRLARLITECGLVHFAYRSDREPAITAMIQEACAMAGRKGVQVKADHEPAIKDDDGEPETGDIREDEHPREVEGSSIAVPEHSTQESRSPTGLLKGPYRSLWIMCVS